MTDTAVTGTPTVVVEPPPRPARTPARAAAPAPADGSSVPARLRIVGWILLATALTLLAVVVTVRSALLTDLERGANADVTQEADEFRTFAARGLDPQTGQPFASAERLVRLHLQRQYPGESEVLLGYDRALAGTGRSPLLVQDLSGPLSPDRDAALLEELFTGPATSGLAGSSAGPVRWGRVDVQVTGTDPGASFLVAELTAPGVAEVDRVTRLLVLVCLGGLLATAGLAWLVAGQILAPVRLVRRAAARITRADLGSRIEVRGRDDVAALAHTFNAMLDRLQQAFSAQQRFTSEASTHLRAPLSVLEEHVDDGDEPAADALRRMRSILDDLAVLAEAERPGFVAPRPVDLADLTARVAEDARRSTDRDWEVSARAEGTAVLDEQRVREALLRLVRNADRHAPRDETVCLGSRVEDGVVELWVADTGPGLDQAQAERVFERFSRADAPVGDVLPGGPGLGLAVVRAVADAHEGSAYVESSPGAGARFGLQLPVGDPDRAVRL